MKWNLIYHNDYTEALGAEEYAVFLDQQINEERALYPFRGDSKDYSVLYHASEDIENVPGLICEIGIRLGAGLKSILDGVIPTEKPRTIVGIDPFGSIPYAGRDGEVASFTEYSNGMQKESLEIIYRYLQEYPQIHFLFFPLEDTEFFKRYADGVPVYTDNKKEMHNQYALVHFDGPHSTDAVMDETEFFIDKTVPGSRFVYDDVTHFFDHDLLKKYLEERGWEMVKMTKWKSVFKKNA